MYHHYYIPLNKTFLLLLELSSPLLSLSTSSANASIDPVIVQVTVKPANDNLTDEMAAFYLNQYEITVCQLPVSLTPSHQHNLESDRGTCRSAYIHLYK